MRSCARRQSTAAVVWVVREQPSLCMCACMPVWPTRSSSISKAGARFTSSASQLQSRQVNRPFLPNADPLALFALPRRAFAHLLPRPSYGPTSRQGSLDLCTPRLICPTDSSPDDDLTSSTSVDMAKGSTQTHLDCTAGTSWRSTDIAKPSTQ